MTSSLVIPPHPQSDSTGPTTTVSNATQSTSSTVPPPLVRSTSPLRPIFSQAPSPFPSLPKPEGLDAMHKFIAENLTKAATHSAPQAIPGYQAMLKELRKCANPQSLHLMLIALGRSSCLTAISSNATKHNQLIHWIFKLDSFSPPKVKKAKTPPVSPRSASPSPSPRKEEKGGEAEKATDPALDPLNLPFTDFSIAMAHLALCTNLLSANSTFLVPYLSMVLRLLFSSTDDGSEKSTKRIGIIHQTLSYATILVPNAADELKTQLPQVAPFKRANTDVLTHYTKQLLRITTYIPILTSTAISAILLKCTEIDVEIHIHDNGDTSIHEDTLLDEHEIMFEMDPTTGSETDRALKAKLSRTRAMSIEADDYAEKLDQLLFLLFTHFAESPCPPLDFYGHVQDAFDTLILTTFKSKFTQFVVLQLCGLDAEERDKALDSLAKTEPLAKTETLPPQPLSTLFVHHLLEATLLMTHPNVHRQSAACYLASFVARTTYTSIETVAEVVSTLLWWCNDYMNQRRAPVAASSGPQSPMNRPGSPKSTDHTLFYTISQATFYIMCFRGSEVIQYWKEGVSEGRDMGDVDLENKNWSSLCCHRYKPLKHCLESVRKEFLHLSSLFDLLTAEEISNIETGIDGNFKLSGSGLRRPASPIQTNATLEAKRRKGGVGGLGKGSNPLDSFFPYDPFLLRRSHPLVAKYYRNWEGSLARSLTQAEFNEDEDEDEEIDSDDESDSDGELDSDLDGGSVVVSSAESGGFAPMSVSYGAGEGGGVGGWMEEGGEVVEEQGEGGVEEQKVEVRDRRRKRADSVASHGSW